MFLVALFETHQGNERLAPVATAFFLFPLLRRCRTILLFWGEQPPFMLFGREGR